MDKKQLLRCDLARIMVGLIPEIQDLVVKHPSSPGNLKHDGTPVTSLDLALSVLVENATKEHFPGVTVYSEENYSEILFPLMAIDPLDGTKEYINNRPEWAVSVALLPTESFEGEGWVYNPSTLEAYSSETKVWAHEKKTAYFGEVSRSEWDRGLFKNVHEAKFQFKPMGSIAYKLGRLAAGQVDFIVSLAPKNIWDIAAGTILCERSKIHFYAQGKRVTKVQKLYLPPLIWCHEQLFSELAELFPPMDKYP